MKHISEREVQLPDAVIGHLLTVAHEDKSVISLGAGEPNFKTPRPILDHVRKVINNSTAYSAAAGVKELREAIARKLRKENRIKTDPENIIVTSGSQEALLCAFLSALDVSEQVIVPDPCYLAYIPQIELVNGVPVYVKLEESENFEVNPDRIIDAIDKKKTQIILLNTPSNPTGTVLSRKTLEEIADIAVEYDCYIFSDEAYEKLVYDKKHVSIASLNGMEDYAVTFQSFSKSFAMCGFRVGYMAGPEKLIKAMDKVHHYTTLTAPHISQLLAIKALQLPKRYVESMRKEYKRRRDYIVKRLNSMCLPTVMPHGAFYTFSNIKHLSRDSFKFSSKLLKDAKVAVVPGREFGRHGEGYIRCSYATDMRDIKMAMERLEKFVKKRGK